MKVVFEPQHHKTACNHPETFLEKTRRKGLLLAGDTSAMPNDYAGHLQAGCSSLANEVYTLLKDLKAFLWHAQGKHGLELKSLGVTCTATKQNLS